MFSSEISRLCPIRIHKVYLFCNNVPDTTLTVGRQRVILDNARFVGNV